LYQLPRAKPGLKAEPKKFNRASTLTPSHRTIVWPESARKALTLQGGASIRPPMAAGAILPPMFFERRLVSNFAPGMAFSQNTR
jgi:hypothetical protein